MHARQTGGVVSLVHAAILLHDHGIGPLRDGGTGEDTGHGASLQGHAHAARGNPLGYGQRAFGAQHILRPHGIAVHRAVVVRRHLQARHDGLSEHATIGLSGVHALELHQRLGRSQQLRYRAVQWH